MKHVSDRALFWSLLAVQEAGSQAIIWSDVPLYQRLRSPGAIPASPGELVMTLAVVMVMQAAHWTSLPLQRRLKFGRHVVLGHFFIWVGEISLFFVAALGSVILFDRFSLSELSMLRLLLLGALIFAVSSYKYQLMALGASMIESER